MAQACSGSIVLQWEPTVDYEGGTHYWLTQVEDSGQMRFLGSMDQGPFDTALEAAQWAWKIIAREVPPTPC